MIPAVMYIIASFASWRVALAITEEEGPFGALLYIREHIDPHQKTWVGRGLNCMWCVSFWASLACAIWYWYFGFLPLWQVPVWWIGIAGGAIFIHNHATKRR